MGGKHFWKMGALVCVSSLLAASQAEAARQGSLGAVSSGTIAISVSIAPRVEISAPRDIAFDPGGKTASGTSQSLCLSSNSATGAVRVSAIGSGDAGELELSDGQQTIAYTLAWAARGTPVQSGSGAPAMELRTAASRGECVDGRGSAAFVVALDPAHLEQVRTGRPYTGTLTLVVSPE
jgi:hypothetical protein